MSFRAQLFEGQLALTPVSFSFFFVKKAFYRIIFPIIFRAPSIKLAEKRIKLNWLLKLSFLNSNFTLTLGYLNSTLNNPALDVRPLNIRPLD